MRARPVYSCSTERKKVEAEKAAARVLWKSNKVKETRQGSESHDIGINGLSTARGILQRFREVCQSTKRDAETRHPAGNWNLAIQVHSQRILTRSALFQPLLKGLDGLQLACQVEECIFVKC